MKAIFGLEAKYYIEITNDNRIKLWDTSTQKEKRFYVEKQHLNRSYTCRAWFQSRAENLGILAVGTSDGSVIMWDLTRGIVALEIKTTESTLTELVFSVDGSSLYVASSSKYLAVYNTKNGDLLNSIKIGKNGISSLAVNPKIDIIAVGRFLDFIFII